MLNKNPITAARPQKPAKKEISEEVMARFQIEEDNNQVSNRRRLKKLCEVNSEEEMLQPEEEEDYAPQNEEEQQQYKQFDVKDDEELQREKEEEEKAKLNKKLKGNQQIEKFMQKQQEKPKKPKKEEKQKPQPQMSMEEIMRIKKQKQQRRKSSDDFLLSEEGEKNEEEIDERQLLAKRMAAYEIYNGSKDNEEKLIQKAMQLSYTATSKKQNIDQQQKLAEMPASKPIIFDQKIVPEKQPVKQQGKKSAKKMKEETQPIKTGPLGGYVISTTGEFDRVDKNELIEVLESLGAQCPKSMVNRCNLLIQGSHVENMYKRRTNQSVDETDKSKKAMEKGINIISYHKIDEFFYEKTGNSLDHYVTAKNTKVNPLCSLLNKSIETPIAHKLVQQTKEHKVVVNEQPKPLVNEPIKNHQTEMMKTFNPPHPVRREQKMEIEKPKAAPTMSAGLLWSDKYKPTKLEEVIDANNQIRALREWLECWEDIHIRGNKRDVRQTKGWNAAGSINSFAALLSGDPGIGKTTTARLLAKEYNYSVTEFNASDVRNKSGIDLMETGSFNLGVRKTMEKSLIIMDEVDGMSSGDRGGITAIISMIKNTKVPIICICNDRSSEKIRSLAGHCLDVKFQKPNKALVVRRLREILNKQGGTGEDRALEQLVDTFQNDMRQTLCYLQVIFKTVSDRITMNTLSSRNQSAKDATVMINHVDAVKRLLNRCDFNRMKIADRTDCFFVDSDMVPLMVQENLLLSARRTILNNKQFHNLVQGVQGMVIGDMLDKTIRKQQEWGLMPSYGFMTCVYAPEKISQNIGFPQFPSWLGKFSTERKMKRLSKEFKDAIAPVSMLGSWKSAKQYYVPIIIREMAELLKQDKIEQAVQLMEHYNITPAMIGDHLTSLNFTTSTDKSHPLADIPSTVKGKLTRLFNKRHEDSKMKATNKVKAKNDHVKFDPLMQELEEVEDEEPEEDKEEEEMKAKPKSKEAKNKKK